MPITGFNIGKETSLVIMHPDVGAIGFALLTAFTSKASASVVTSLPITGGGKPVHRVTYAGWEGSFEVDRSDSLVDALFQQLEDNFYAGRPETYMMINQTINNPDGSISEFRYTNCVLKPDESGTWKGDDKVTQRFMFLAQNRETA